MGYRGRGTHTCDMDIECNESSNNGAMATLALLLGGQCTVRIVATFWPTICGIKGIASCICQREKGETGRERQIT